MDITKMTAAERAELKAQLEAEERAEKQKREDDVAAYKSAVDEFCRLKFSRLKAMSEEMRRLKDEVFAEAETLIKLKEELFKTKSDRHSDQFTTSDGRITLALGNRTNDGWDDTVEVGVAKVKEFIKSLAKDDDSAALTEMVMGLLAKDRKGNLKASRVLQLREIARKSGYSELIEATDIIQGAYRPEETCQFISASWKERTSGASNTRCRSRWRPWTDPSPETRNPASKSAGFCFIESDAETGLDRIAGCRARRLRYGRLRCSTLC